MELGYQLKLKLHKVMVHLLQLELGYQPKLLLDKVKVLKLRLDKVKVLRLHKEYQHNVVLGYQLGLVLLLDMVMVLQHLP